MELIISIRQAIGWFLVAVLIFALVVILYSSGAAQSVRRVAFADRKNRLVFSDAAKPGEQDTYVIALREGQDCEVEVRWQGEDVEDEGQGSSGMTIVYPTGEMLADAQDGYIRAATAGDYKIVVSPETKKNNYRYRIIFKQI